MTEKPAKGATIAAGPLAALDAVARACVTLRGQQDPAHAVVADALELLIEGAEFDAALNLPRGWRAHRDALRQRSALAAMAALVSAPSARALAAKVTALLTAYERGAWPADRIAGRRPPGLHGLACDYLRAGGATSNSRVRHHLSGLSKCL